MHRHAWLHRQELEEKISTCSCHRPCRTIARHVLHEPLGDEFSSSRRERNAWYSQVSPSSPPCLSRLQFKRTILVLGALVVEYVNHFESGPLHSTPPLSSLTVITLRPILIYLPNGADMKLASRIPCVPFHMLLPWLVSVRSQGENQPVPSATSSCPPRNTLSHLFAGG